MKLTRKQWMMLVVLVLGAFVTVLNQTLVTPALPSIMTEMNVDQSTAQWLTTGFTLVNAIMIPITAFLQDRFSTRKLFVFSMSLFAVGTLLAAVGLNFPVLRGGRLVQAAGAGILMPIYVQSLHGLSATVSGLVLMPGAILMGIMNPLAGKWFDRHGPRRMAIVGMSLLTLTTFAFAILNLTSSIIYITIVYTVRMFSMSLVNMPITTWGMNALDNKVMNHGTSVNNTLRQVAGSLGTAIIIAVSTQVQNIASPGLGATEGTMLGINAAFLVCTLLCLIGLVMTIALVKDKPGEEAAVDEGGTRKSLLTSIMKTDVYSLSREATVEEAMRLFVEKNISAAPIVDESGEPVGFISDGDILKRLSPRSNSFTDPIVLINSTVNDDEGYDEKLAKVMQMRASEIGAASPICVSVHANLTDVCRVLSENHLKKVPVLEAGHIVGIINRSDITQYSMAAYLADHPERAVYCGEGPSGQYECVEEACEEC